MVAYFATCAGGLERVLNRELRDLGATDTNPGRGGVRFNGERDLLYRANLHLRTAIRVLVPLVRGPAPSPEALYELVDSVDWSRHLTPDHTLAVDCNVNRSRISHSHYAALKTKDAICDQFVRRVGRRPSVDTQRPGVKLNLHIANDTAVLSLDSSGESLHKRGYRSQSSRAPLNEALAAGLLGLARYDGTRAFVDPMCGSGTLLIEAAQRALNYAPGLDRPHFNFMGWPDFDEPLWRDLVAQAQAAVRPSLPAPIEGSDLSPQAIGQARANLRAAGLAERIRLTQRDLSDFRAPECDTGGLLLCNPPYGERLGVTDELKKLYRRLGEVARRLPYGWRMAVFTEAGELADQIGLPVYRRTPLYNGPIECQLIILDLT